MSRWEKVKRVPSSAYKWVRKHLKLVLFFIASLLIAETANVVFVPHVPPTGQTVETRWMINGQTSNATVWWLNTSISGTAYQSITIATGVAVPDYVKFGIKVFIGYLNGTRELVSGTDPVALAQYTVVEGNNNFEVSAAWAHSAIARSNMANISVEVFADKNLATPTTWRASYCTENITNLGSITSNTWTVYYNGREAATGSVAYRWGDSSIYDTRITGFGWDYLADATPPTLYDFYVSSMWGGENAQFAFDFRDNNALAFGIFGCNVTGSFQNETASALSGIQAWLNVTKTLPSTSSIVQIQAWANDTGGNWATTGSRYLNVYAKAVGVNNTYYMQGVPLYINQLSYSRLDPTTQGTVTNQTVTFSTTSTVSYWDIDIYTRNWTIGNLVGLDQAVAMASGTGIVSATATINAKNLTAYDSLWIDVKGDGTNPPTTVRARFISPLIGMASLNSTIWKVYYYVERVYSAPNYLYTFRWGNSTFASRIENVTFAAWNPSYFSLNQLLTDVDGNETWANVEPYIQTVLARKNKTDLETMIDNYAVSSDWLNVLKWSAFTKKLGVYRVNAIKSALDGMSMTDKLPTTKPTASDGYAFNVQDRWALYGYWWAVDLNYRLDKWNVTAAFQQYNTTIFNYGQPLRLIWANWTGTGNGRYYDEDATTISGYVFFEEILNVTGALDMAKYWWDIASFSPVQYLWDENPQHFNYNTKPLFVHNFETEGCFFLKTMSIMKYYAPDMTNWTKVTTDLAIRYLSKSWNSYQWLDYRYDNGSSTYYAIHFYQLGSQYNYPTGNPNRRTQNTIGAWFVLLGVYPKLNATWQQMIRSMIYGNLTYMPAWELSTYREGAVFLNGRYAWGSDSEGGYTARDDNASAYMMANLFMLGIVPQTTSIAFPLEEIDYEYYRDIDPDMFQFNLTTRTIRIAVDNNGTLTFQYGMSPVTYNFTSGQGIYEVKFSPSWNLVTSAVRISDLPSGRIMFSSVDSPPVCAKKGVTSNIGGSTTTFYSYWTDDFGLNNGYFGTNNTGYWINESVTLSGTAAWSNLTKTLNATQNAVVQYQWWIQDTNGAWATTGLQNVTVYYYTNFTSGWKSFNPYIIDVGHTLGQINASLTADGISWQYIDLVYTNGTEYVFVYGMTVNADVPVAGVTDTLWVYTDVAGVWYHNYG